MPRAGFTGTRPSVVCCLRATGRQIVDEASGPPGVTRRAVRRAARRGTRRLGAGPLAESDVSGDGGGVARRAGRTSGVGELVGGVGVGGFDVGGFDVGGLEDGGFDVVGLSTACRGLVARLVRRLAARRSTARCGRRVVRRVPGCRPCPGRWAGCVESASSPPWSAWSAPMPPPSSPCEADGLTSTLSDGVSSFDVAPSVTTVPSTAARSAPAPAATRLRRVPVTRPDGPRRACRRGRARLRRRPCRAPRRRRGHRERGRHPAGGRRRLLVARGGDLLARRRTPAGERAAGAVRDQGEGAAARDGAALVGQRAAQGDGGLQLGAGPVELPAEQREDAQLVVEIGLFRHVAGEPGGLRPDRRHRSHTPVSPAANAGAAVRASSTAMLPSSSGPVGVVPGTSTVSAASRASASAATRSG